MKPMNTPETTPHEDADQSGDTMITAYIEGYDPWDPRDAPVTVVIPLRRIEMPEYVRLAWPDGRSLTLPVPQDGRNRGAAET